MQERTLGELAFNTYKEEHNMAFTDEEKIDFDWRTLMPEEINIWEKTAQAVKEEAVISSVME